MAVTYWQNRFTEQRVAMDDVTRQIYIYQQKNDGIGNFYYFTYQLTDPNNELGLFPGGNNYSNFLNQHYQEFNTLNFSTYQDIARQKMVDLKNALANSQAGTTQYFRSAISNFQRNLANGTTLLAKGYDNSNNNVSQLTDLAPSGGNTYTLKFQSVAGGSTPQGVDLRAVVDRLVATGQYSSTTPSVQAGKQIEVVDHFQANPYFVDPGGGGGGGDTKFYEIIACVAIEDGGFGYDLASAACSCKYKEVAIYGDQTILQKCTAIYGDASGLSSAEAGFYVQGREFTGRYWDGRSFTVRWAWPEDGSSDMVANEEGVFSCGGEIGFPPSEIR
jgi:hypothetical protein